MKRLTKSPLFWCASIPAAGFLLLFLAQFIFLRVKEHKASIPYETTPASTYSPMLSPARTPVKTAEPEPAIPAEQYVRRYPIRVYFTRAKLSSAIHAIGKIDGAIGTVDSAADCAWYNKSAVPKEQGNCILSGHDRWNGEKGTFAWLKEAKKGDEIVVELDNGDMVYYSVTEKGEYPYDDFPKYHLYTEGDERLTLITCKGDYSEEAGTSLTRIVVVCENVSADKSEE